MNVVKIVIVLYICFETFPIYVGSVETSGGLWVVYEVGESCNQATKQSHRIFCNLPFLSVVDQDERE